MLDGFRIGSAAIRTSLSDPIQTDSRSNEPDIEYPYRALLQWVKKQPAKHGCEYCSLEQSQFIGNASCWQIETANRPKFSDTDKCLPNRVGRILLPAPQVLQKSSARNVSVIGP